MWPLQNLIRSTHFIKFRILARFLRLLLQSGRILGSLLDVRSSPFVLWKKGEKKRTFISIYKSVVPILHTHRTIYIKYPLVVAKLPMNATPEHKSMKRSQAYYHSTLTALTAARRGSNKTSARQRWGEEASDHSAFGIPIFPLQNFRRRKKRAGFGGGVGAGEQ